MQNVFHDMLLVASGSAAGGVARYAVTLAAARLWRQATLPAGTLCVNVLGCALIGFLGSACFRGQPLGAGARLVFVTGFCGAFTTFSTFVNDDARLVRDGMWGASALYLLLSLVLGFAALFLGGRAGRMV